MERELEPVGQTREIRTYNHGKTQKSPHSTHNTMPGKLLKRRPIVRPEELPGTTTRRIFQDDDDLKNIIGYLTTYQRQGDNRRWDEFRNKIPPPLLKLWGDLLNECRRNGFIAPRAEDGKIVWRQVTSNDTQNNGDLCTMCERECKRREAIETGEVKQLKRVDPAYQEQRPCWDK